MLGPPGQVGEVDLSPLFKAPLEQATLRPERAEDIMNRQVCSIRPEQTVREAAQVMLETELHSLPVVDATGCLTGILTRADPLHHVFTSPLMSTQASSPTQPLRQTGSLPEYLAYLIQSNYGKAYFLSVAHKTTNLACINSTKLEAFPTLLPSFTEQEQIAAILQACDSKITAWKKK
jgi:hypothetical protein